MRPAASLASALLGGACLATASGAHAGTAWGDATLERADVRLELDSAGKAEITHTLAVRVSGKKFRAFVVEGVDDGAAPPEDAATQAGLDGPGWPAKAIDAKGAEVVATVEPAKEPRKLRVRLGNDGLSRGEWTLSLRYRVDLAKAGAFVRDGALTKLTWSAPQWPEGYDGGKIVVSVPAAPTEPRLALADVAGDGEHSVEGFALVALKRGPARDELEITRPHVSPHDDARWLLRLDPKALAGVPASAAALAHRDPSAALVPATTGARRAWVGALAALFAAAAYALARRDRDAAAAGFRPLVPLDGGLRALAFGAATTGAVAATWTGAPVVGSMLVVASMTLATQRAPFPNSARRRPGRWLAIPESSIEPTTRRVVGPFDPSGPAGRALGATLLLSTTAAVALLARRDPRAAVGVATNAAALLPLFLSGRSAQLPADRVLDAWSVLSPIADELRSLEGARVRPIVRGAGRHLDELRLRVEIRGATTLEIGCGVLHGAGGCRLVPEVLVRSTDAAALDAARTALGGDDDIVETLGRTADERVLCLRSMDPSPRAIALRVRAVDAAAAPALAPPAPTVAPAGDEGRAAA